ncbi:hypothetical protein PCANC_19201 [Puccinia coronata f. sp. avenae]|uniref:Uncharacterized protein n=1 Tax=Puccinia coronata f. sp. avenae TaxID=200324 RepID=A0A2N5SI00_9BASI|nr:hypothetical protein PCANC_19201 [Puccinia coronata f. sp. avenae]
MADNKGALLKNNIPQLNEKNYLHWSMRPKGRAHAYPHAQKKRLHAIRTPSIGVRPCQTGVQSLHACLEGVQSLHALRTGVQALHACARPSDRRAGFARLLAHVSLLIQEAYVSRAIGATVYVAPIARLTNPPPSSTTQIRKQMTGHARQTLTRPNHQVPLSHSGPCFGPKGA